ncbi:MAG: glycosyltransferase family 2 protein [Anaerolineae bacterium]|nr:glycosyltransferase family 2 protein [Anaerolineae bacterium]
MEFITKETKLQQKILALIPAYNESGHIHDVVKRTREFLPVLVVDDGSTDQTAVQAEEAGATVIRQRPNQGKGAALIQGFQYAVAQGYDAVVMLDADGQHDPNEIPALVKSFIHTGADLVVGKRDFSKMPIIRRCSNTIGRFMLSWAMGNEIPDNQSGYRLLSSRLVQEMIKSRERGFEFEVEMIVVCLKQGWKLAWVPIQTIYADEKSHIRPLHHVIHYFRIVWKARRTMRE